MTTPGSAELQGHEYAYDHRCVRIVNGEVCYRSKDDPVHQKSTTTACRCHEAPEAWRWCPLPEHDHEQWTEHGWNCPASCEHPNAVAVRRG